ncbi:Protein Y34B4A.7 [Aphelenchoides avenae]|nr:Protein Y34B4A.7 [Aphelenchus avenae]
MVLWIPNDADYWEIIDPYQREGAHLMLREGDILQEIVCSKLQKNCFYVIDANWIYNMHTRRLVTEFYPNSYQAIREIQPTKGDAFTKENAQKWPANPSSLIFDYLKVLASAPFATSILGSGSNPAKILSIGLGAGSIDSFFLSLPEQHEVTSVELDPAVQYIARRWFGVDASSRHNIVVNDGAIFIKEQNVKGNKYDVVVVDACYAAVNRSMACPVEDFFMQETVQQLRSIIKDRGGRPQARPICILTDLGVLAINTYSQSPSDAPEVQISRQMLLDGYRQHFKYCFFAAVPSGNQILVCTTHDIGQLTSVLYLHYFDQNVPKTLIESLVTHVEVKDFAYPKTAQ